MNTGSGGTCVNDDTEALSNGSYVASRKVGTVDDEKKVEEKGEDKESGGDETEAIGPGLGGEGGGV